MLRTLLFITTMAISLFVQAQECPVIPRPQQAGKLKGQFTISANTEIFVIDPLQNAVGDLLQQELLKHTGVKVKIAHSVNREKYIKSLVGNPDDSFPPLIVIGGVLEQGDAYKLEVNPQRVKIEAGSGDGYIHGVMTLVQLARVFGKKGAGISVPCWRIEDAPAMAWRGFMLDESRHFFGKKTIKLLLDEMAMYKLNRFHWHLTDEPGWRIEIKQYPRLTTVGGIGNRTDSLAPAAYYTQEDVKEIVAYAAARGITVIPEIDMPGHATAANKAYPEFSGGGTAKYPEFTFNPGKEGTYQYLTNILREVNALFPAGMVHIGGDEVSFGSASWNTDPHVQSLMKRENMKTLVDVEHYFIRRMSDSLMAIKSKMLGWDEVTAADLPVKETIVFWWRQERPEQLKSALDKGYKVVVCPRLPFYFDFVQDSSHTVGRRWGKEFNPLRRVYEFNLNDYPAVTAANRGQIIGYQANQWTEVIQSEERLYFMTFPRLLAMAEAAWTAPAKKDFAGFEKRLAKFIPLLKERGLYVMESPEKTPEPLR
ncbi:beta-N-acetylhexosaminidase [Chitinophaga sp. NPDC101104]|uniref:beta-N-acetylhexosaminidase n=1 Tax=Chitinophaga sp. NPDC101104 TaxID=3390561 RepID=UPI003D00C993